MLQKVQQNKWLRLQMRQSGQKRKSTVRQEYLPGWVSM